MEKADVSIKTARRVFEILEYFERVKRPVVLKEIASKCDYPTSSAAALLKSMVALGYLFYDRYERTYMPTMRIAQMGHWLYSGLFGESAIIALVADVHEQLDELTSISTQSDLHAQYIHCLQTSKRLRYEVHPGDIRPLAASGIGRAMLSLHSDDEIDRLVRRLNALGPTAKPVDVKELMKIIKTIRRNGFIFAKHLITKDEGIVAMPLPMQETGRIFVLGVGGPVTRLEDKFDHIIACMRDAVDRHIARSMSDYSS